MTRCRAVTVAVLLALAGCHGFVPWLDDGTDGTPTPVASDPGGESPVSPSADGDDTGSGTPTETGTLAPGVTDEGVENVTRLLERHHAILERESGNGTYVAEARGNRTVVGAFLYTSRVISTSRQRYVVQPPDRLFYSRTGTNHTADETAVSEGWLNESDAVHREAQPGEPVRYFWFDRSGPLDHPFARELRAGLAYVDTRRGDVTVEERSYDGDTVYVLTRTADVTRRDATTRRTYTFHVRDDGFILRFSVTSIEGASDGQVILDERHLTFEIRADGTLEPPEWIEQAREATTAEKTDEE